MPINQKLLVGFSEKQRRAICARLMVAYRKHIAICASYGLDDADRPIVAADSWEHFCEEFIAVFRAELTESPAPFNLDQLRHGRRDYGDIYREPLDISLK